MSDTVIDAPVISPSARRMRETRERRREGYTCVTVELHQRDITGLVRAGWLADGDAVNRTAVARAIGVMLDQCPVEEGATKFPTRTDRH
jgi:hypothetical protein